MNHRVLRVESDGFSSAVQKAERLKTDLEILRNKIRSDLCDLLLARLVVYLQHLFEFSCQFVSIALFVLSAMPLVFNHFSDALLFLICLQLFSVHCINY